MKKIVYVLITLCVLFLTVGVVSADDNSTVPYRYSDQYDQDVQEWYEYYSGLQNNSIIQHLREKIYEYLIDSSLSWDAKQEIILPLMGWDYKLEYYKNKPDKYTVNRTTGEITWDLGVGNWWSKLFGNGIQESLLPQTIAQGDALYKVYCDNYAEYVQALHDAGDP